jgi:hypothetical protein
MKWEEIFKTYAVDTLEFIKTGKDLAVTQGSLYIQELIKWEIYKNSFLALLFLFALLLCVIIFFRAYIVKSKDEVRTSLMSCSLALGFMFVVFICDSSLDALKAYTAPRVIIIEKLQRLIK